MISRLLPYATLALIALSVLVFIQLNSLPDPEDYLRDESSLVAEINSANFHILKNEIRRSIENGTSTQESVVKAKAELNRINEQVDSIADWFEKCRYTNRHIEWPDDKKKILITIFIPVDSSNYVHRYQVSLLERLDSVNEINHVQLRELVTQNILSGVYDQVFMFVDSLSRWTESVNYKSDYLFSSGVRPSWKKGLIAFNPPDEMDVGDKRRVEVRISKGLKKTLLEKMPAAEAAQIDSLLVGDVMIVRLDGEDFEIKGYDEEEQGVLDEGYTRWEFEITPTRSGRHSLFVKAGIVYSVPGIGPTKKFFPVYEREIEIHVSPFKQVTAFATERWEFLFSTFLIPALAWGWSRIRNRGQHTVGPQ